MAISFWRQSSTLLYLFLFGLAPFTRAFAQSTRLDAATLEKAIAIAPKDLADAAAAGDVTALYKVAKQSEDTALGVTIFHALADAEPEGHVLSQVALGFHYYETGDKETALGYFESAGESGPHQAALYNAGKIYAELSKWPNAMAYIQAAILMGDQHPEQSDASLTETCRTAFEILSQKIAALATAKELSIEDSADVFMYASESNFPSGNSEAANQWRVAVLSIHAFQNAQESKEENNPQYQLLETALSSLKSLWENESTSMSKLQAHLLLTHMHKDVTSKLINNDDTTYLSTAADYAEALAMSPYCAAMPECFLQASAAAETYYRRANDTDGADRIAEVVKQHSPQSEEL